MTAGYDAMRGTEQRFTDALSGSDGTSDPSVLMPVLDVYPDALSAPMPDDLVPVVVPPLMLPGGQGGVRAEPVLGPAARQAAGRTPAQRGMQTRQPAVRQPTQRQPAQRQPARPPVPNRANQPGQPRAAAPPRQQAPRTPAQGRSAPPAPPTGPTFSWQGRQVSAGDVAAMFRNSLNQSGQVDRQSFQATHPQSQGSASPTAVAPAAPMASQYSPMQDARNAAQARRQSRPATSTTKRKSSGWAVAVFFFVILFATGLGQRIIDFITELLNR